MLLLLLRLAINFILDDVITVKIVIIIKFLVGKKTIGDIGRLVIRLHLFRLRHRLLLDHIILRSSAPSSARLFHIVHLFIQRSYTSFRQCIELLYRIIPFFSILFR